VLFRTCPFCCVVGILISYVDGDWGQRIYSQGFSVVAIVCRKVVDTRTRIAHGYCFHCLLYLSIVYFSPLSGASVSFFLDPKTE
jgi:hypothetical protein